MNVPHATVQSVLSAWDALLLAEPALTIERRLRKLDTDVSNDLVALILLTNGRLTPILPGPVIAKGRDSWFMTEDGVRASQGAAHGEFLRNRLEAAFLAGVRFVERGSVV